MTTESAAPAAATTSKPDIAGTVKRLRETFATGRTRSVDWRKQQLQALDKLVEENEPAIAAALEQDLGRKPFEAWLADIASTAG
jgi:aldehyde dehydrogenase (NAD+)